MGARHFTDLEVWKLADELDTEITRIVRGLPPQETMRLGDQMIRAVRSIPANIAEGFRHRGLKAKANFYTISEGSCAELENHLLVCAKYKYCDDILPCMQKLNRLQRMLHRLIQRTLEGDFRTRPLPEPPKPPRRPRPKPPQP